MTASLSREGTSGVESAASAAPGQSGGGPMPSWSVLTGDCREVLAALPGQSFQCCVTSPPYWGLRDYGHDDQIGLEPTPDEFVAALVGVFREVRRALRDDGTLWLNLGDTYAANTGVRPDSAGPALIGAPQHGRAAVQRPRKPHGDCKPKDLIGIPWMVAFALRADGWYLRSEIIWVKRNCMPESVGDRPTRAHEQVFLLSKSARYFYDAEAIREPQSPDSLADHLRRKPSERSNGVAPDRGPGDQGLRRNGVMTSGSRNRRSVWTVASQPYSGAHFATFPPKLIEPCILAGAREGDAVLDPFAGAGTTGVVALRHGRSFTGVELNESYAEMARARIRDDAPLLNVGAEAA